MNKFIFNTFALKEKIKITFSNYKSYLNKIILEKIDWIEYHKGLSLFFLCLFLSLITGEYTIFNFWGVIVYLLIIKKEKNNDEKELNYLNSIDFKLLDDAEDSLSSILDRFITDCFNRDVIFFRGIKDKEYINSKDEKEILDNLMNSVISNISPLLRKKIDLYYGEGQSDIIIGRKCFVIVSLFVANNNKAIYNK